MSTPFGTTPPKSTTYRINVTFWRKYRCLHIFEELSWNTHRMNLFMTYLQQGCDRGFRSAALVIFGRAIYSTEHENAYEKYKIHSKCIQNPQLQSAELIPPHHNPDLQQTWHVMHSLLSTMMCATSIMDIINRYGWINVPLGLMTPLVVYLSGTRGGGGINSSV